MDNKNSRKKELDDFWDISELIPRKSDSFGHPKSTDTVEIVAAPKSTELFDKESSTLIKRYIPPHSGNSELSAKAQFDDVESYAPDASLIHRVTVKKHKTAYNYYGAFLKDAINYMDTRGTPCDYIPFFSYVPQYDQMNDEQRAYYFWFRENARRGNFIKTDQGYLFLYVFELLNLGKRLNVKETQYILMSLWNEYNGVFPAISSKLADWICDYSLLHHLSPPVNLSSNIIKKVISLKEFYISLPKGDMKRCAQTLMCYCSSYDYRSSKFYTDQNKELFDTHILGALTVAVRYYSQDGNILSGLNFGDSTISRDVYSGAVCVSDEKYRIEVDFCSFSRSNELRFFVGDIVRYSENKLRAYIGVKSKMTVYSVTVELRRLIDEYFTSSLPSKHQIKQKATEKHEYDVLYDVPIKPLSLSEAAKIEAGSWETTKELISAFDESIDALDIFEEKTVPEIDSREESAAAADGDVFEKYRAVIISLINGNLSAISDFAKATGKMSDSIIDEINEIAYDSFGDLLIEDDGTGNYSVIDDYKSYFI
ncbi:MAG: TerB N-terminal domain-containing protein [Clostridia bacterium]|nr:TerB N-terminal domain-containing protein [Clostridia bacterium]